MKRLGLLLAAALLLPATASAYTSMYTNGNPLAWDSGNPETSWYYSSNYECNDLGDSTVINALEAAIDEWGVPGCTNFNASYAGRRSGDPSNGSQNEDLVGFLNNGWPASWGSTTLAVTSPVFYSDGEIIRASMAFNGTSYDWVTGNPGTWDEADLQAVAAHEFGHWIGFDHNSFTGSTLTAYYSGGTSERTLTCDDTEGVCWKYPSSGNSCTADRYCECGVGCDDGLCDGIPGDDDDAADDDDVVEFGECDGSSSDSFGESEPNDWEAEEEIDYATPDDTDLTISGGITCGNDGSTWTADWDWYVVDFPCAGEGQYILDWSGTNSDLDFYVWASGYDADGDGELDPYVWSVFAEQEGPILGETVAEPPVTTAPGGGRMWLLVLCWEGNSTNYEFTFDWEPHENVGDDDDDAADDDDASDDDDGTDDDDDDDNSDDDDGADDDDDDDDDDDGGRGYTRGGCVCDAGGVDAPSGLLAVLLLGGLALLRRRI